MSIDIMNSLYHASVTAGLATAYALAGSTILKSIGKPPSLEFKPRDLTLLSLDIAAASMTKDWLVAQGVLPPNIPKLN